jgi:putative addiction module component (TIGR02574 family)
MSMADPVTELVQRGRALPPQDRERLVEQLLQSLNEPAAADLSAAWELEIQERLAAYDRGEVQAVNAADVFAKARLLAR